MADLMQRELVLPVAPPAVWRALTDESWLARWLADEARLELRPGGDARFRIGDRTRAGWVEEATPPTGERPGRLAFWWEDADADGGPGDGRASRVCLELTPTEDGTRLRVVETRPLDVLDLVGTPLGAPGGLADPGTERFGPALVAV
ncbi:MAG: SRPBCC domain-containing protein [Solirubrobacterales bacterium]|nr:SRPBCC domain-containing protein [Solirubrobacterales bacterium]